MARVVAGVLPMPRQPAACTWVVVARCLSMGVLAMAALALQGCSDDVPSHTVGNWRAESDYLITYEFVPPGGSARNARLNSCGMIRLSQTLQCSGRGVCRMWDDEDFGPASLHFCECDRDWADPECGTPRKSQSVAYFLSVLLGWLGFDQFYLGFPYRGVLKMMSLGGFGIWWAIDVVRIGSAPVMTHSFRVAADLPHWLFVLTAVCFGLFFGFLGGYVVAAKSRTKRRRKALLVQKDEEAMSRAAYGASEEKFRQQEQTIVDA